MPVNYTLSYKNRDLNSGAIPQPMSTPAKVAFNSQFLAQYDSHFNSIQQIYTQTAFFKLLQTTMPDVAFTRTREDAYELSLSNYNFYKNLQKEFGGYAVGVDKTAPVKVQTVLKLLYRFRYCKTRKTSKHLQILLDQKFSGSGLIRSGRYTKNYRRNIRYGAFVRTGIWAWYTGVLKQCDSFASYKAVNTYSTTQNMSKNASAFFRRRARVIFFEGQNTRKTLYTTMLAAVTALRTVWYRTARHLHMRNIINTSGGVVNFENFKHHEMLRFGLRAFKRFRVAPAGGNTPGGTDAIIQNRLAYSDSRLKHHNRRIGFAWYEKKLWGYTKTYKYWRYMKWVAHFYFRGLAYHRLFYMRLDVFLVYHLRVRNIKHARILVYGGHAFIGDAACLHPNQPINPMTVISISRYARRWLNYYFNRLRAWRNGKRRNVGLLVFGRYFENAYLYGPGCTFAIPYGDPLDILWAKRAGKAGFFAFSYFQGQKTISSAWW